MFCGLDDFAYSAGYLKICILATKATSFTIETPAKINYRLNNVEAVQ